MLNNYKRFLFWVDIVEFVLLSGTRAETSSRTQAPNATGSNQEGVSGLKSLGVRDLCYRMAFLACNVVTRNRKVCYEFGNGCLI